MDVYPRSKTWPYLTVVLILFLLALWRPGWWISGQRQFDHHAWAPFVLRGPHRSTASHRVDGFVKSTTRGCIEPSKVALRPSVAQRIAISPEPAFADESESHGTARFPREVAVDLPPTQATTSADPTSQASEPPVGPILLPGGHRLLDLTPADMDTLVHSLPNAVMEQSPELQSAADSTAVMATTWPRPICLWDMIGQLGTESAQVAAWVNDIQDMLNALQTVPTLYDLRAAELIDGLSALADKAPTMEAYLSPSNQRHVRCIQYGIQRRCDIWREMHTLSRQQEGTTQIVNVLDAIPILDTVDERLQDHPYGKSWRSYLMLEELRRVATETWAADTAVRKERARNVLRRMSAQTLTAEQKHMLNDPAVKHLRRQLEDWADVPADLPTLITSVEQFEQIRSETIAAQIVQQMKGLQFVRHANADELYQAMDMHYRNANARISVSSQLLNDLLPVLEPEDRRIRDQILGASVSGKNRTWTDLRVRLIEDPSRWRLRIEVDGQSRSRTVSSKGPIRLFTNDRSKFRAGKELIVSDQQISVTRAEASATGRATLTDVETDYDRIPFLGWIVRQMAMDEHDEQRGRVRASIQNRIAGRAKAKLDDSIHERLTDIETRFEQNVLGPLRDLELDPKTIELRTTPERLVMRCRLAASTQLAAYTPRPRGLPSNVMSIQVHESLANNLLAQVKLDDQRFELEDLMAELTESLNIRLEDIHEEIPPNVSVHLGNDRPIQFEFDDERILVTIRIKELKTRRRTCRNFVVRGRYRADVSQTHVDLERDGGIQLISEQLGFRDQIALRGIFTKVMTRNHRLRILRGRFLSDQRLRNLGVTQFVARDGWIGVSIGPIDRGRIASESPVAAR